MPGFGVPVGNFEGRLLALREVVVVGSNAAGPRPIVGNRPWREGIDLAVFVLEMGELHRFMSPHHLADF